MLLATHNQIVQVAFEYDNLPRDKKSSKVAYLKRRCKSLVPGTTDFDNLLKLSIKIKTRTKFNTFAGLKMNTTPFCKKLTFQKQYIDTPGGIQELTTTYQKY